MSRAERVRIFVQTGSEPPKCLGRAYQREFDYRGRARSWWSGEIINARWYVHPSLTFYAGVADRWWLVECENADRGRTVIAMAARERTREGAARRGMDIGPTGTPPGRILAHGSREPREAAHDSPGGSDAE